MPSSTIDDVLDLWFEDVMSCRVCLEDRSRDMFSWHHMNSYSELHTME